MLELNILKFFTTILSILKDWEEREREISGYRLLKIGEMMEDGDESLVPYYIENDGFIVEIKYTFIKQVGCKGLPVMPYSVIRRKIRE